jgi:hypothetical protein
MIGPITPDVKRAGARSAGNPHAACDVAGAGNGITDDPTRARKGKPRIQTRGVLRITAPVLDPTALLASMRQKSGCFEGLGSPCEEVAVSTVA